MTFSRADSLNEGVFLEKGPSFFCRDAFILFGIKEKCSLFAVVQKAVDLTQELLGCLVGLGQKKQAAFILLYQLRKKIRLGPTMHALQHIVLRDLICKKGFTDLENGVS